jgi:hypothetical protein
MSPDTLTLIRYRLSQARDSLEEAKLLLKEGMSLRSVMNRSTLLSSRSPIRSKIRNTFFLYL